MRYLLDTHVLLWARAQPHQLSAAACAALESADNALYLSVVSLWECAIKSAIGKLDLPRSFYQIVAADYEILPIEVTHVEACADLPMHHRDPFDRMLVAQAKLGNLVLITRDQNIAKYDVPTLVA